MATIKALIPIIGGRNLLADPRLSTLALSTNGATVVDTYPSAGAPDGGSFYRRTMTTANTTSPMSGNLSPAGLAAIPVVAGLPYVASWYAARNPVSGPSTRMDWVWYNAAGAQISTSTGTGHAPGTTWQRWTQLNVAPALAAFGRPGLRWSGTSPVGQVLDLGMAQLEQGTTATEFTDNRTITPLMVLDYGFTRESRNIIIDLMGSKYPAVFLREAQSRSGTLTMLFTSTTAAGDADRILQSSNRFHFQELAAAQDFHFVRTGPVTVTKVEGINYWTVAVGFREVAPI